MRKSEFLEEFEKEYNNIQNKKFIKNYKEFKKNIEYINVKLLNITNINRN